MRLQDILPKINVADDWGNQYRHYIPKFVSYAKERTHINQWEPDVREELFRAVNCVSSLQQGNFSNDESLLIQEHWDKLISPICIIANNPDKFCDKECHEIMRIIRKYTNRNMSAASLRLIAAFCPSQLSTIVTHNYMNELYQNLEEAGVDLPTGYGGDDIQRSHYLHSFIKDSYPNVEDIERGTYAWRIRELLPEIIKNKNSMIKNVHLLKECHNLILTGAPGTGKTYLAKNIASQMILGKPYTKKNENNEDFRTRCEFVQFHPSFDYTDFVEGLRPTNKPDANGNIGFERRDGIFKKFCKKAVAEKEKNYVFIIDEINRGEISKIFGELFFSIDPGYRGIKGKVTTQYQTLIPDNDIFKDGFYIPENVYIIGTMNDIDRSVESMDFAMRRHFAFREIKADENIGMLDSHPDKEEIKKRMDGLNVRIKETEGLGTAYQIGGAYFAKLDAQDDKKWNNLWNYHLKGLLSEYLRGMKDADDKMKDLKAAYDLERDGDKNNQNN